MNELKFKNFSKTGLGKQKKVFLIIKISTMH